MSEARGTEQDTTLEPQQKQQSLPLRETEQAVTQREGSTEETVLTDALLRTDTPQDANAPRDSGDSQATSAAQGTDGDDAAGPAAADAAAAPVADAPSADTGDGTAAGEEAPSRAEAPAAPRARTGSRSAGRTRTPKQDPVLTEAVALAREAVVDSPQGEQAVGEHLGVVVHEDRLLTHLFECRLRGYPGWTWYATVARAPRTKHVTVCESGLIAGPDSLLAPDWVPWEERMQAMKEQESLENAQEDGSSSDEGDESHQGEDGESEDSSAAESAQDGASS